MKSCFQSICYSIFVRVGAVFLLGLMMTACGGGGSSSGSNNPSAVKTGVFVDAPVAGLQYSTASQSGVTNDKGEFLYKEGEQVMFSLDGLALGSAAADAVVPVTALDRGLDVARLLQTLDKDAAHDLIDVSGITIPAVLKAALSDLLTNHQGDLDSLLDAAALQSIEDASGVQLLSNVLVSEEVAILHIENHVGQFTAGTFTESDFNRQVYISVDDGMVLSFEEDGSGFEWNDGDDNGQPYKSAHTWSVSNGVLTVSYPDEGDVNARLLSQSGNRYTLLVEDDEGKDVIGLYKAQPLSLEMLDGKILAFDTSTDPDCSARTIKISGDTGVVKEQCTGGYFEETVTLNNASRLDNSLWIRGDNSVDGNFSTKIHLVGGTIADGKYVFIDEPQAAAPDDVFFMRLFETDSEVQGSGDNNVVFRGTYTDSVMDNGTSVTRVQLKTRDKVTVDFAIKEPQTAPVADLILFAGGSGVVDMPVSGGSTSITSGNFLVRSRDRFVANGMRVIIVDAPSDVRALSGGMKGGFRHTDEHRQDIESVISYIRDVNGLDSNLPLWLVGTSRGTESAAYLALNLQASIDGVVLTSPLTVSNQNGTSILELDLASIDAPVLLSAHEQDGCSVTPPAKVNDIHQALTTSIKQVDFYTGGSNENTDPCKANTWHGFLGIEESVVTDIADFIKTPTIGVLTSESM